MYQQQVFHYPPTQYTSVENETHCPTFTQIFSDMFQFLCHYWEELHEKSQEKGLKMAVLTNLYIGIIHLG